VREAPLRERRCPIWEGGKAKKVSPFLQRRVTVKGRAHVTVTWLPTTVTWSKKTGKSAHRPPRLAMRSYSPLYEK
jgi:hypothetical protein